MSRKDELANACAGPLPPVIGRCGTHCCVADTGRLDSSPQSTRQPRRSLRPHPNSSSRISLSGSQTPPLPVKAAPATPTAESDSTVQRVADSIGAAIRLPALCGAHAINTAHITVKAVDDAGMHGRSLAHIFTHSFTL
eukprot:GHVU01177530.1.p1 GENE.GHVU01177530.1~~GHVU01177530.1.p1  ORF type:complete len:138 (-),score=0.25 GHVU01177530.1:1995-2408(-)